MSHFILHRTNLNNNKLETEQLCHTVPHNQTLPKCLSLMLNCWDVALLIPVTRLKVQKKNHVGVTLFEGPELCLMSGNSSGQGRGWAA